MPYIPVIHNSILAFIRQQTVCLPYDVNMEFFNISVLTSFFRGLKMYFVAVFSNILMYVPRILPAYKKHQHKTLQIA